MSRVSQSSHRWAMVCLVLLLGLFAGSLYARTWRSGQYTYEGEFVALKRFDGVEKVRVRMNSDGKIMLLKWKYLSEGDRVYVQQRLAREAEASQAAMERGGMFKASSSKNYAL